MDAMEYLEQDTWSTLQMEDWELAALAALLDRVTTATPAEINIRQRILDADHRRLNRRLRLPADDAALREHLRTMHRTTGIPDELLQREHFNQHEGHALPSYAAHVHFDEPPAPDEPDPSDDIDMLAVVERVRAMGHTAVAEHTGGGCASIFAGPVIKDGHGDDRYAASAGPGSINGWRASTTEFYLGPDDDVPDPVIKVTTADPEEIAILIVDQIVRSVRARSGGTSWTPESPSTA